jgi:hypothetical protein
MNPEEKFVDAINSEAKRNHSKPASPAPPGALMRAYRGTHQTLLRRPSSGEYLEGRKHRSAVSDMETRKHHYPAHKFLKHVGANDKCFTKVELEDIYKSGPSSTDTYFLVDTKTYRPHPPLNSTYGNSEALVFLGRLTETKTVEQEDINPDTGYAFSQATSEYESYGKTQVPTLVFEKGTITKQQYTGWDSEVVYKYNASGDNCSNALVLKGGKRRTRRNKKKSRKVKRKRTTRKVNRKKSIKKHSK